MQQCVVICSTIVTVTVDCYIIYLFSAGLLGVIENPATFLAELIASVAQ